MHHRLFVLGWRSRCSLISVSQKPESFKMEVRTATKEGSVVCQPTFGNDEGLTRHFFQTKEQQKAGTNTTEKLCSWEVQQVMPENVSTSNYSRRYLSSTSLPTIKSIDDMQDDMSLHLYLYFVIESNFFLIRYVNGNLAPKVSHKRFAKEDPFASRHLARPKH